jgi:hypothetical protein
LPPAPIETSNVASNLAEGTIPTPIPPVPPEEAVENVPPPPPPPPATQTTAIQLDGLDTVVVLFIVVTSEPPDIDAPALFWLLPSLNEIPVEFKVTGIIFSL